ncbi:AAA family ATPase [Xenorhabdus sp. KK7.4]|uniref:AAA family ATPase n=1 Tax=Xenorhabdus sp. KK7.4 TaxID=1851572 RepID=UPI000C04B1DF|nr:AAA family ATPase [Xenorhabdus sp. KK7.4]PHM49825.1 anticodon nuclease [Xenorhabdus sp. KK7.4]
MGYLKIRNVASYHKTEYLELDLSKKITLIYGQNGSGKSTIAGYFNHSNSEKYKECKSNLNENYNYIVYNKKFTDDNFYNNDTQPGIFTLNRENKEVEIEINEIEITLKNLDKSHVDLIKQKMELTDKINKDELHFQNRVWNECYKIRNSSLYGLMEGYKKDKKKFFSKIINFQSSESIDFQKLIKEYNDLKDGKENAHTRTTIQHYKYDEELKNINTLLNDPIIASGESYLSEVINKLGSSDWIKQGMDNYLMDNTCPFCQENTINENFKNHLKNVFDKTYNNKIRKIEMMKENYTEKWNVYFSSIKKSLDSVDIFPEYKKTLPLHEMEIIHQENIKIFNEKIKNPSSKLEVCPISDKIKIIEEYFTNVNKHINEINDKVKRYKDNENRIREKSLSGMKFIIKDLLILYTKNKRELEFKLDEINSEIDKLESKKIYLNNDMYRLRKNISNIDETIDIINNKLMQLGVPDIKIEKSPESNYYCISRKSNSDKNAYKTLSEGEKTLITFLYFIEKCKERKENDKYKNLIVIDDPISSLSFNYIYDIASFIKYELFDSKHENKIIILTHNLFFFHELIKFTPSQDDKFEEKHKAYRLYKGENTKIEKMDRKNIKNEYQLLWQTIKDIENGNVSESILPNVMRNILEYYFSFLNNTDKLRNKLHEMSEELSDDSYKGFYRFISRGSHSDPANIVEEFRRIEAKRYLELFKRIFEKTNHIEHYNKMME